MLKGPLHYHCFLMFLTLLVGQLAAGSAVAQTTAFTYQGKLVDSGNPSSGNYDFQFTLFDTATVGTGTQQGSTVNLPGVQVTNGIFTVQLDFGSAVFPGADRFLEIAVKPAGGPTFTVLAPRQPVTSTPYTVRSATAGSADTATNAAQLGGLAASGFIQNTTSQQAATSFNIGGTGTANILNAATQFNLGGNRILSNAGTNNVFAGIGAGAVNTGSENAFFGRNAGFSNTTGSNNSSFGNTAGGRNTTGSSNSFFGSFAGSFNSQGESNSFFGGNAGFGNTTGSFNAFFGKGAGNSNDLASGNSFFGTSAGFSNTTGELNAFFGEGTGSENTTGTGNTFIGRDADFDAPGATGDNNTLLGLNTRVVSGVSNGTAIGSQAQVTQSNSLILGGISGVNGGTNTNVGIGTTAPRGRFEIVGNWDGSFGAATVTGDRPTIRFSGGPPAANQQWILHLGSAVGLIPAGSLSFFNGGTSGTFSSPAMALTPNGTVAITNLGSASMSTLCRNASNEISTCSSSLRYKTSVLPFAAGLEIINRLRPISFTWKQGGMRDIGLGAEEVAKVEPLLTFRNDKGEIEGVKYSQLNVVLINAVKQQQEQIDALKKLVCADHPNAEVCK